MDRALFRALQKWDLLFAERRHLHLRAPLPLAERVRHSLPYHQARWLADHALRQQVHPHQALDEAQIGEAGRRELDEARFQLIEEGVENTLRKHAWSLTVFVPFAFWDDQDATVPVREREPQSDDQGYAAFMTRIMALMAPFDEVVERTARLAGLALAHAPRPALGFSELADQGWLVQAPFETWSWTDRLARMVGPRPEWIKAGLIPITLSAPNPEGLGLLQDVLTDYLQTARVGFNTPERHLGLPGRREAAYQETAMVRYEMFASRMLAVSQTGRGDVNFLVHHRPQGPTVIDIEVQLILPHPHDPKEGQVLMRQTQMVVHSPVDLARIQAPWLSPAAEQIVSHWSTINQG